MQATTKPLARRVQAEKEILSIAHHFPRLPIPIEIRPHVGASPAGGSVSNAEGVPHLSQHLEHSIGVLTAIEFMVKRGENADANSCDGNASNHADLVRSGPLDGAADNRQPKNCKRIAGRTTF